ncbi:hypothetical protein BDY17DRAFT_356643 [Neohortaea acidophila]|uniref:Uncharacterized protein n=1 Tax=Neohortaea acidophila TaxID=245834 RepID=A0A6A6PIB3_9PEZI|nr:uncharacterized protein BDY17DRAFT_356643 [Neohortaea acidophila]KAF2479263.1 hypothetical protein BDY17DRAFT_356643 [Neohortaea acidophila]
MAAWCTMRSLALLTSCILLSPARAGTIVNHANHLFNAIHSSMRQFGSSLNHNGMSLFIAHVPPDTELYHGSWMPNRINGTEWLAFEPEHALFFSQPSERPPPRDHERSSFDQFVHQYAISSTAADGESIHGYLHTYRTRHALRLLYLDGQSAAKSDLGTLDVQDLVLLHHQPPPPDATRAKSQAPKSPVADTSTRGPAGPPGDAIRAIRLCRLIEEEWNARVDGILRMEEGFEIILCNFSKHLDVVEIAQTLDDSYDGAENFDGIMFSSFKAAAARYDGIGGGRVALKYDHFVTLYDYQDALYFDEHSRPRVRNETALIEPVRTAIKEMVLHENSTSGVDWQSVTDMLVLRWADRIAYLASGDVSSLQSFQGEIWRAFRAFADYSGERDWEKEGMRCTLQYLPANVTDMDTLAARAVFNVSSAICRALQSAWQADTLPQALAVMQELKAWLGWTEWKKCRGCGPHEVCFIPIWPMGEEKYFERPECLTNVSQVPLTYWFDD